MIKPRHYSLLSDETVLSSTQKNITVLLHVKNRGASTSCNFCQLQLFSSTTAFHFSLNIYALSHMFPSWGKSAVFSSPKYRKFSQGYLLCYIPPSSSMSNNSQASPFTSHSLMNFINFASQRKQTSCSSYLMCHLEDISLFWHVTSVNFSLWRVKVTKLFIKSAYT